MNKGVIKFSFLLLILISLTQLTFALPPEYCQTGEYPVIRMSDTKNAHAISGDNNPTDYPIPVCLSNSNEPNPPNRVCTENKVIRLSGPTNAHAESPSGITSSYTNVCFNDVSCTLNAPGVACPQGQNKILGLSSLTNAHLALPDTPGYSYNLCCTSGASPSTGLYFADGRDNPIAKACLGDSVQLIETGTSGTKEFKVYKDGIITNDLIKTISGITPQAGTAKTRLTLLDSSLVSGESIASGDKLFFTSDSGSAESEPLLLILPTTECTNEKPVPLLSGPKDGGVYFKGELISFSHSSYDLDSEISVEWTISDTIIPTEEKTFLQFNHTYQTTGQKIISLKVSDGVNVVNERISILIIGNDEKDTHVYTNISKPANLKAVVGKNVDYDSLSSYVLEVEKQVTGFTIECLGGDCPAKTEGCPFGSDTTNPILCQVTISDPNIKRTIFTDLDFIWKFFGTDGEKIPADITGKGIPEIKSNSKMYPNYGQNKIELILGITPKTSNIMNMFEITRPSGCTADGRRLFDKDTGSFLDTSIPGVCSGANKTVGDADDCCPAYTRCVSGNSGSYCSSNECAAFYESGDDEDSSIFGIETCYDYNSLEEDNQIQCEADCAGAYLNSIEMDLVDLEQGQFVDEERCVWVDTIPSVSGKCAYSFVKRSSGGEPIQGTEGCIIDQTAESVCTNGFKTITYQFSGECGSEIENTKQVPCGRSAVELPFFTFYNLIFSILGIALIYFIINKRTRK